MTPHWTLSEAIARAFPGAPHEILELFAGGDLQREFPNWMHFFVQKYEEPPFFEPDVLKVRRAWSHVLRAYDAKVGVPAAEEE